MRCSMPGGCFNPLAIPSALQSTPFADHDWVLRQALKAGTLRRGDGMFVATNFAGSARVRRAVLDLRNAGIKVWVGLGEAARATTVGVASLAQVCRSVVQEGVVDLATAAGVEGSFFGAVSSTFTEHILDLRRWRHRHGADGASQLFLAKWQECISCAARASSMLQTLRKPKRPRIEFSGKSKKVGPFMKM
eukprot:Hpha_TRINITY_DN12000_c0_g1::TRINITY_DN12000_c0_g1_i1::g.141176::m.141176